MPAEARERGRVAARERGWELEEAPRPGRAMAGWAQAGDFARAGRGFLSTSSGSFGRCRFAPGCRLASRGAGAGPGISAAPIRPSSGSRGGGSGARRSDGSMTSAATAAAAIAPPRAASRQLTLMPFTSPTSPGGPLVPRYSPPPP